jgi:hypothetical protein
MPRARRVPCQAPVDRPCAGGDAEAQHRHPDAVDDDASVPERVHVDERIWVETERIPR